MKLIPNAHKLWPPPRGAKLGAGVAVVTASLVAFVAAWEGTEYVPYRDIVGVWTVCEGITGRHVIPGKTYTRAECDALLSGELEAHGAALLGCLTQPVTQPQYEALASWTFNVGARAACASTLVRRLNAAEPAAAWCQELLRWDRAGGRAVRGLTKRRAAELQRCLEPA